MNMRRRLLAVNLQQQKILQIVARINKHLLICQEYTRRIEKNNSVLLTLGLKLQESLEQSKKLT